MLTSLSADKPALAPLKKISAVPLAEVDVRDHPGVQNREALGHVLPRRHTRRIDPLGDEFLSIAAEEAHGGIVLTFRYRWTHGRITPMEHEDPRAAAPPSMRRRLWIGVAAAAIVVAGIGTAWLLRSGGDPEPSPPLIQSLQDLATNADAVPSQAELAPQFAVPTLVGSGFSLRDHLAGDGRPVILNLWASWCFPCRAEMPTLDAFQDAHPEVAVVGVAVQDDQTAAEEFAKEIGVDYIIGFDDKDVVNAEYAPLGLPATFWISSDGRIAKRLFGTLTEDSLEEDLAVFSG